MHVKFPREKSNKFPPQKYPVLKIKPHNHEKNNNKLTRLKNVFGQQKFKACPGFGGRYYRGDGRSKL